jgi:hypothetical protein
VFWRPLFVLLYFSFGHCIVCPLVLFFWPLYCLALHRQRNKHFNLIVRNCKSLGIKTEYMQRAVVRLVNMISCLAYDWTVKEGWKDTWHNPKVILYRQ